MTTERIQRFGKEHMENDFKDLAIKYTGPKFDAHTHVWDLKLAEEHLTYVEDFNIKKSLAILDEDIAQNLSPELKERFIFARFLRSKTLLKGNAKDSANMVQEYYNQGYPIIKFWFGPRWIDYVDEEFKKKAGKLRLSNPIFDPIYSKIEELGLIFLVHNSDPDTYYERVYQPESKYGTKKEHLDSFEEVLKKYPKMKILGAHFGAQPEHLDNLARWFDTYPNYYVDASSARWMAREFSQKREESITFFKKYSDRILWGTDLSFGSQRHIEIPEYYFTRYLTYQALLETKVKNLALPFPDPENDNKTVINGLDLPMDVLENIYWKTAEKFFHGL